MGAYIEFLKSKRHEASDFGFEPVWMPNGAFDFQEHIINKAVRKGRVGIFADTGLGKTLQQLAIAENVIRVTNKRVLILTPLAVAFQFIEEATRIGIELKDSYFKQAKLNLELAAGRFSAVKPPEQSLLI